MVQVIPNSHYWNSVQVFLNWLDCIDYGCKKEFTTDYIRTGFKNALLQGYDLRRLKKQRKIVTPKTIKKVAAARKRNAERA